MTGQGEAGQHKAVQASWHRFYLLTSRLLASKWARKWQKIATLQKRWSHSMTVVNRSVLFSISTLNIEHWCTTAFTVENLTGETRHWGCGLRTRSSAQFCKWRQQQLLLAFLCMVSSKHQQTNHQVDQATSHDKLWLVELHKEIFCAQAYQHWRRQLLFTDWDFPSCPDNSTQGECCRWSNRMIIQK